MAFYEQFLTGSDPMLQTEKKNNLTNHQMPLRTYSQTGEH